MSDIKLESLGLAISTVLDEGNSSFKRNAVTVVDKCPETFNITVVYVLNDVDLIGSSVASCEVVVTLTLPDSKHSISHVNIIVGVISSKSCHEVPWGILSVD